MVKDAGKCNFDVLTWTKFGVAFNFDISHFVLVLKHTPFLLCWITETGQINHNHAFLSLMEDSYLCSENIHITKCSINK